MAVVFRLLSGRHFPVRDEDGSPIDVHRGVVHAGWISLLLIGAWLVAVGVTYRAYVSSFRDGLKERSVVEACM